MKKYNIGYTQGTFDLFHVGHLNLLENAKKYCDKLIVGVNSDELVLQYKNKKVNITAKDRARIIKALKCVDEVYIVNTLDKSQILEKIDFDVILVGDDWKGNQRWENTKTEMNKKGKDVIFLPYTKGISTTKLAAQIKSGEQNER